MRGPLAYAAAAFAAGIGLAGWVTLPPAWLGLFLLIGAAAALLSWRRGAAANIALAALMAMLGFLRAEVDARPPQDSVERLIAREPRPIAAQGILASSPEWARAPSGFVRRRAWLTLAVIRQGERWRAASGKVLLYLPARAGHFSYGDRLELAGEIRASPGRWMRLSGACGTLTVSEAGAIRGLPSRPSVWVRYRRRIEALHGRLTTLGRSLLDQEGSAYLEGLLLGNRQGFSKELAEAFRKTGTVHVLVVSGLNVGLVGFLGMVTLSFLRLPRNACHLLIAAGLISYCLLTGSDPPILRATLMGVLLCASAAAGREFSGFNALGAAALGILGWDPRALADVGFQLSFAAVGGILLAAPWVEKGPRILKPFAVSVSAWLAVLPLLAWHFHLVTPVAPLANLWVIPWASFLMAVGFLLFLLAGLHPALGLPAASVFTWMAWVLTQGVTWFSRWPGASFSW
ncbi:MAG: ComEC/Rec2 family competence protein [Candidatus Omnitrophica bacterium]|nr:ComEC/Rec2 family competence protein [Candidatus Omnitrophota bacterium]